MCWGDRARVRELEEVNRILVEAMKSIANNACCKPCQEAKLVARKALKDIGYTDA